MTRTLATVSAVALKDARQFWPLAATAAASILISTLYGDNSPIGFYLPLTAVLVSALFFIGLIHADAPASLRHEWLTRPAGRPQLLLAKALLAAAVILLPALLGDSIAAAREGASVTEALLLALSQLGTYLSVAFFLLLVAAVTTNLLQVAGVIVGVILLLVVAFPVLQGLSDAAIAITLGFGWIAVSALTLVFFIGGAIALWLQYAARRTVAARAALAATIGLMGALWLAMSWDVLFAAQRLLTRQEPAPEGFTLTFAPGCFATERVDPLAAGPFEDEPTDWTAAQRAAAGPGAIALSTTVRGEAAPEDWRMAFGRTHATFVDGQGRTLDQLAAAPFIGEDSALTETGRPEARYRWLLSAARLDTLVAQDARMRIDTLLTLLRPAHSGEIAADGQRRRMPGIGACSATPAAAGIVAVTCFRSGLQPDLLVAHTQGSPPQQEGFGTGLNFAPDWLQRSIGQRRTMMVPAAGAGETRVTVTAYEAVTTIRRSVTAPAALGAPSCEIAG